ncbi:quinolinate synthase NadA [Prochlorococcus sp. MIT 0916]|uniref:quinolinate synthase NadA n=1 Tax=Prochlorococcus sp. MIT 0916 TaxID=3082521 RepID=UPI0039B48CC8
MSVSNKRTNLINEINFLRKQRNAIILAHYYQEPAIQDVADFIGDSLELSRKASKTNADVIVFCGVHFMAETAKILCPNKTVLLPDFDAGCTLADDCQPDDFQKFLDKHPDHFSISYINCSAAVKAKSDLICTSSNAVDLVNKLPKDLPILFSPDRNLGRWVERQSGRKLTLWPGRCLVHETFNEESLIKLKIKHPSAEVLAHPECQENLLDLADFIGSTSKLLNYSQNSENSKFIVLTEPGIIHQMRLSDPLKSYIEVPGIDGCSCNECPYMRMNTLEKVLNCLKEMNPELHMDEQIRSMAYKPLKKMLDMSN